MNKMLMTLVIVTVIITLIAGIVVGSRNKDTQIAGTNLESPEMSAQSNGVADASDVQILYWGTTCPYCHDVIDWIEDNNVEETLTILQKEVYNDRVNAAELSARAESCGLNTDRIGVPFMYTSEGTCVIGAPDITKYLQQKASQVITPAETASTAEEGEEL